MSRESSEAKEELFRIVAAMCGKLSLSCADLLGPVMYGTEEELRTREESEPHNLRRRDILLRLLRSLGGPRCAPTT
jgi:hypothetical protein